MASPTFPNLWSVGDVEMWARALGIADETRAALSKNRVDGATLITLDKAELRSELQIHSLAARRHLWDALTKLRAMQEMSDYPVAIDLHEEEIEKLGHAPINDGQHTDFVVVSALQSEATIQRQIIEDNILAHRLQGFIVGQREYEDAEIAALRQTEMDRQLLLSEYDHKVALSLSGENKKKSNVPGGSHLQSLFSLCLDVCVQHKVNVAEALQNGRIQVLNRWVNPFLLGQPECHGADKAKTAEKSGGLEEHKEAVDESDEEMAEGYGSSWMDISELPTIPQCSACYGEDIAGFNLPCEHSNCVDCMRRLFETALRDTSLLPLTCCELPIDMTVANILLSSNDVEVLKSRVAEIQATRKMFCPICSQFINLDFVDSTESSHLDCRCGAALCTICATASHPGITCEENKARRGGSDEAFLKLAREQGWKQCPSCSHMIELVLGCNHMVCSSCRHHFCFQCLLPWDTRSGNCSSGKCAVWEEPNLYARAEERVAAAEMAAGRVLQQQERAVVRADAVRALQANEVCNHHWRRVGLQGACERCGYDLWVYGMVCQGVCRATVCYTCCYHRIPRRGWG